MATNFVIRGEQWDTWTPVYLVSWLRLAWPSFWFSSLLLRCSQNQLRNFLPGFLKKKALNLKRNPRFSTSKFQ